MRDIIFGILLGAWVTIFLALMEKYKMTDYALLIAFVVVTFLLIFVGTFRLLLRFIAHICPRLFVYINRITAPVTVDDALKRIEDSQRNRAKGNRAKGNRDGK
ncbi:hypothetical protein ACFLUO_05110 [Chloroflexota bacterium]